MSNIVVIESPKLNVSLGGVKLDSGIFYIISVLKSGEFKLFPFPINHEYLEMMGERDLLLHYAPKVIERLLQNA